MARAPLLQLTDISLTFGGTPVFSDLSLVIQPGDRLALVGRNGSGKSTLMKVMAGLVEPDAGERVLSPGDSVGYMEQEPAMEGCETLGDFAVRDLGPAEMWRVEAVAEGLKFDPATRVDAASGGERRRAALAKIIAEEPDLMLLDEPTNHLDIEAVQWLEDRLAETRRAFVVISHDRAFLRRLTRGTLWIDRGAVRRQDKGFDAFEEWRDKVWADEDEARHKLDRKIKAEARWAVEGISARRKRNQGRVRALQALRAERAGQIRREGTAAMALEAGPRSGKRVIEARGISKAYGDKLICRDFSLKVQRGDRVAFVGPNGVGKTTLIEMLTGQLQPESGEVVLGTNVEMAVFDQRREALDPEMSLWESLTGDKEMRVSGRADQVLVRGTPRHVVGYLKDFLFDEAQARAPVRSLSGGEKARLLLAKLMAKPSNLLVLDEPTNDLDIETLDPEMSLWESLTGDKEMRVSGRADQVLVRGTPRHVVGYLKDFLFDEAQARAPVRSLSGGEKARLLLAKLMAKPSNLLVLDEPTNDLDIETLDLLQEILDDYDGTVLLVSHDRDFLDRVATTTVALEGRGRIVVHAGGWSDYAPKRKLAEGPVTKAVSQARVEAGKPKPKEKVAGLSFTERHRLDTLPGEIERLEAEIAKLGELLSDPDLFTREPVKFRKATEALTERQHRLAAAEDEWLALEERAASG